MVRPPRSSGPSSTGSTTAHPPGPAPDEASLREAALGYLARYATTQSSLRRVLNRRIERWARRAEGTVEPDLIAATADRARQAVGGVIASLVASNAVNDEAFAEHRAQSLTRAGRSRRAVAAHLANKGVDPALARTAARDDPETELAAALVLARRRRIGPFRTAAHPDEAERRKELGVLARAGFAHDIAARALAMERAEAEERVLELRR